jgi:hypothetical protein
LPPHGRSLATAELPRQNQGNEITTQAANLRRESLGDGLQTALEGAPRRVAPVLGQEGAQLAHLVSRLIQDGEQGVDIAQTSHDHNHQHLQEQAIRVDLGPTTVLDRGRHRDQVDECNQRDENGSFVYHETVSVLRMGNLMVRDGRAGCLSDAVNYL